VAHEAVLISDSSALSYAPAKVKYSKVNVDLYSASSQTCYSVLAVLSDFGHSKYDFM